VGREGTMILPPLGLTYIASFLRENDIEVKILDLAALNLDNEEAKDKIEKLQPDIIGITSTTNTIEETYEISNLVDGIAKIIVGGPHPTNLPERTLNECSAIDVSVVGEGEQTMLELVKNSEWNEVKGITYRKNGKIVRTPDRTPIENLDSLPFPARDLLPLDKYWTPGVKRYPFATMITSRGCPHQCIFCTTRKIHGRRFRYRSADNVIAEIDQLVSDYKIKEINILDDNFTVIQERAEEICDKLIKRNYDLIWKLGTGVRVDRVDKELIMKMKRAGCYLLAFGIETGSQRILNNIKKGITLDQISKAIRWTKEAGMETEGFFMIGNLGENRKTIMQSIEFAKKLDMDYAQFQIFTPLPGTEYTDIIEKEGRILTKSWASYNAFNEPIFEHGDLTPRIMMLMQKLAYKKYYIRPKIFVKKLMKMKSLTELKANIKGGMAVFKMSF